MVCSEREQYLQILFPSGWTTVPKLYGTLEEEYVQMDEGSEGGSKVLVNPMEMWLGGKRLWVRSH